MKEPPIHEAKSDKQTSLFDEVASLHVFKDLAPAHLNVLAECAIRSTFNAAESIFREGDPANRFYVLLSGSVALMAANRDGHVVPIQTLRPGDDLGWSWLFPPFHWHFTARAIEPTEAILFHGVRLREHCEKDRDFGYEITKRVAQVLIERLETLRKQLIDAPSRA